MNLRLMENLRIYILVLAVVGSLLLISTKGLSFGIDFVGGTEIKMALEEGGEQYISAATEILKNRLNGLGLKSIQVLPEADKKHLTIRVSATDPEDIDAIEGILKQQAVFEQLVEGELCARGDEIRIDLSGARGSSMIYGERWEVYVQTMGDAAVRCGEVMEGKAGRPTDLFIDRPKDSVIIMSEGDCKTIETKDADYGYTIMGLIEERIKIPVLCYPVSEQQNLSILEEVGVVVNKTTDLESFYNELDELKGSGGEAIFIYNETEIPPEIMGRVNASYKVDFVVKNREEPFYDKENDESWVNRATGLRSTLEIQEGLTHGAPIYSSVFQGTSKNEAEAKKIVAKYKIWLTSGNLPVEITIVGKTQSLPELGQEFLRISGLIGFIAIVVVSLIIIVRYRAPKISIFVIVIGMSEVLIILGFASLVAWELDLAAIAGIIASLGTGVDHQIVITDETLRGERKKEKSATKVWDIKSGVNRAFFIIFVAAATTISAMLPLLSIIDLRGFAFTTIVGFLIGVFITRPAYGKIIEKLF